MTIKPKSELPHRPSIDLTGPEGNAFAVLGRAKQYGRALELDVDAILREMTAGDYKHLVATFVKHFGAYVDINR